MSKQNPTNPFEHLKITAHSIEIIDYSPLTDVRSVTITDNSEETAVILTKRLGENLWCGGFQFYWEIGNVSYKKPDPANGLFRSEREARLYYIAFLSLYMDYFTEGTKNAINNALREYSQQNLFE